MEIKIITPVEFDRDGYRQQWLAHEIIVLLMKDDWSLQRVDCVSKGKKSYSINTYDSGDYTFWLRPYEHGLIIIRDPDYDELRRQLSQLVLTIPDEDVIYQLCETDWQPSETSATDS